MPQFRRAHIVILSILCAVISSGILVLHPGRERYVPPRLDRDELTGELSAGIEPVMGSSTAPRPRVLLSGEAEHGEYRIVQYIPVRGPIDVNRAPESLLCTLPGIGPGKARQILETRREQGGFRDFDDFQARMRLETYLAEAIRPAVRFGGSP